MTLTMKLGNDPVYESPEMWQRFSELRMQGSDSLAAFRKAQDEFASDEPLPETQPSDEPSMTDAEHAAFYAKTCSLASSVHWVAAHLVSKDPPSRADAPSPTGWNLFRWASASAVNGSDFIKCIWAKLIPSQAQMGAEDRFDDDSQWLLNKIEVMRSEYLAVEAEEKRLRLLRYGAVTDNGTPFP